MGFHLGIVVCARKISTWAAEAGELSKFQGSLGYTVRPGLRKIRTRVECLEFKPYHIYTMGGRREEEKGGEGKEPQADLKLQGSSNPSASAS